MKKLKKKAEGNLFRIFEIILILRNRNRSEEGRVLTCEGRDGDPDRDGCLYFQLFWFMIGMDNKKSRGTADHTWLYGEDIMRIEIHENGLPAAARDVREQVFIEEQGFQNELDEIDDTAAHILLYDGDRAVATCRIFPGEEKGTYLLGRLAVRREYRGKGIGSQAIRAAEDYVRAAGGETLCLHSQCRASGFYSRNGYTEYGEIGDEEGCPHIWMRKSLLRRG